MADDFSSSVDWIPVADPLYRHAPVPFATSHCVLGHLVRCTSNSRYVCRLFDDAFGACGGVENADRRDMPPLTVRVIAHDGSEHVAPPVPVRHLSVDETRLVLQSPASVALVDPVRHDATAFVTAEFAADRMHFQRAFLDAMTLALVTHFDRHPVHASAIVLGDRAVLLAGASGAGKSTLAHTAYRNGIPVLSEDTIWVQRQPDFSVWGLPRNFNLFEQLGAGVQADPGEIGKVRVGMSDRSAIRCVASAATVCVLQPHSRRAALSPLSTDEIVTALSHDLAAGFDRYAERHADVVRRLAASGGWRLELSNDPLEAVTLLRQTLGASS